MKLNHTRILLLAFIAVFVYASCKKSETKPVAPTTTDYAAVSKQVALSLMQGLNGNNGGSNIKDGLKIQSNISASYKGSVVLKRAPLCGYTIDTTYKNRAMVGDSDKTYFDNFKFIYTCSTNRVDGYLMHDSLVTTAKSALFKNSYTAAQDYTVKALDSTYKLVSTQGSITSVTDNMILRDGFSVGYDYNTNSYKLSGLKIDFSSGTADIITGVSEFKSTTSYMHIGEKEVTETTITGTIEFLGNHKARLTINQKGTSYMVDMLTGLVKPI